MPILVIALINQDVCSSTQPLQFKPSHPLLFQIPTALVSNYTDLCNFHTFVTNHAHFDHLPRSPPHILQSYEHQLLTGVETLHDNMPSYPASNIFSCGHFTRLQVDAL